MASKPAADLAALAEPPSGKSTEKAATKETPKTITPDNVGTIAGLEVRSVDQLKPYVNILVYGDSGVGKTTLAGSASVVPEMSPVLVIDIEGGTLSLSHAYPDVHVVRVQAWNDMVKVFNSLRKGEGGYRTVILDSLTEIQKFSMDQIMQNVVKEDSDRDPDIPGIRDWGKNVNQTRQIVRLFRDLKMNVIFTALADVNKDDKTGKTTIKPSLQGKVKNEVAGFMDIVAYMYVKVKGEDQQRLLLTQYTEKVVAKDRTGRLPMLIEAPTMPMLHDLMYQTEGVK